MHAPSEHTVNGDHYDLELHFVHTYADDPTHLGAVIGVFFDTEVGDGEYDNPLLHEMFDFTGVMKVNSNIPLKNGVGVLDFLSNIDFTKYWTYEGSLTTPPCTEGIRWNVIKEVQPISKKQLELVTALWAGNSTFAGGMGTNRETQKLGDRHLYYTEGSAVFLGLAASIMMSAALALF